MRARILLWAIALVVSVIGVLFFIRETWVCFKKCGGMAQCLAWALECMNGIIRGLMVLVPALILALIILFIARLAGDGW